jgi:phosphomevalonate kinase
LVVSGAYSVLDGAPAIVVAVDRYVVADTSRPAPRVTAEVRAAIEAHAMSGAPWFDASALRMKLPDGRDVKLGLGSSAAILVASMAAAWFTENRTIDPRAMFYAAVAAHRRAQGGGSGIDVAASVFGGTLVCKLSRQGPLSVQPHELPEGTVLEVFGSPNPAVTPELLNLVRQFAAREPAEHARILAAAGEAATKAANATSTQDLIVHLEAQALALAELGRLSGAPIFTPDVIALARIAAEEGAVFYPSGAGGGDVAIHAGPKPASDRFRAEAEALGRFHVPLQISAPGVHVVSTPSPSGQARGAV